VIWKPRHTYLPLACILAGLFAFLPCLVFAAGSLPISIRPLHFDLTASPGDELHETVYFWNGTDTALSVHMEAEDIRPQDEEGHVAGEAEDAANSLKNWVKPVYSDVAVYPKQEIVLDFTIDVPPNADPGTHWGGLAVRTSPGTALGGAAIQAKLGAVLFVTVRGEITEQLALHNFSVPRFAESGSIPVEAQFRNEGTVHEAPQGFIEVRNVFGSLVATGTLPVRSVLPGDIRKVDTQVGGDGLWLGRYTVLLDATYGDKGEKIEASAKIWVVPVKQWSLWLLSYGPWILGLVLIFFLIRWEPKRLLLAAGALIRDPSESPEDANSGTKRKKKT
jgi:hypothetical protein